MEQPDDGIPGGGNPTPEPAPTPAPAATKRQGTKDGGLSNGAALVLVVICAIAAIGFAAAAVKVWNARRGGAS